MKLFTQKHGKTLAWNTFYKFVDFLHELRLNLFVS